MKWKRITVAKFHVDILNILAMIWSNNNNCSTFSLKQKSQKLKVYDFKEGNKNLIFAILKVGVKANYLSVQPFSHCKYYLIHVLCC